LSGGIALRRQLSAGDGYVRSETVSSMFIQRESAARRIYGTILGAKTNTDGYKHEGITYPNGEMQRKLMEKVYAEAGVDPGEVTYIEAHGTGTKVSIIWVVVAVEGQGDILP